MELLGEFVGRDGQQRRIQITCEGPSDSGRFQGLLSGLAQMREQVTELLKAVEGKETPDPAAAGGSTSASEGEDDEAEEEESNTHSKIYSSGPPTKRIKPLHFDNSLECSFGVKNFG
ncbi:EKC/KEOPS complex subunit GON7 [Dromiciops gliroides]|uniref:EKC/KEOPS complex subunit GON7 n=1 Tax=Dromiciops gliroides TaxID=33562 RepID=UPI001CC82C2F|nr:EKC/KEOPS complex subunit GON7 [Dromiciops gliroides]XP_043840123.1 EKC/KEOPS complex subunit GON7 [Dromiciops gliroides]